MGPQKQSERKGKKDRFVIFPGKHEDIWDCYKSLQENFWTLEEIDWHQDEKDRRKLSQKDYNNLKVAISTGMIVSYILGKQKTKLLATHSLFAEAYFYFSQQLAILNAQSECFNHILENLNCSRFRNAEFSNYPTIKWLEEKFTSASYSETLLLFCLAENLFYNNFFYQSSILKQRNLMPGLVFCSELITRDKKLHTTCLLKLLKKRNENRLSLHEIETLLMEAMELEQRTSTTYNQEASQNLGKRTAELLESLQQNSEESISTASKNLVLKRIAILTNSRQKEDRKFSRKIGF